MSLYNIVLKCMPLFYSVLHIIVLYCTAVYITELPCTIEHCVSLASSPPPTPRDCLWIPIWLKCQHLGFFINKTTTGYFPVCPSIHPPSFFNSFSSSSSSSVSRGEGIISDLCRSQSPGTSLCNFCSKTGIWHIVCTENCSIGGHSYQHSSVRLALTYSQ